MEGERADTPLDSYLVSIKPSPSSRDIKPTTRPNPKTITLQDVVKDIKEKPAIEGGISEYNRAIKRTLGKEDNPVTNSTSYSRTMHVQSCATGHQGGGGGASGSKWTLHRNAKLRLQAADKQTESLKGVIGYISGYTGNEVTNTQLKACVERQGGQMVTMANGRCTHIFITSNLSGSKAQKYLESKKKNKCKLVLPSWAFECEKLGKRVSESRFIAPIKHEAQTSAFEIYASKQTPPTSATFSTLTAASSLLAAPPTIPSTRKRSKLPRTDSSASSSEELIILSPSPSPNTKSHRSSRKPSPTKKRAKLSPVKEKKEREKGKKVEELLVLGSSDVELEDPSLIEKLKRPEKEISERKGKKKAENEEEEEEELDDFGMPPSGQRR